MDYWPSYIPKPSSLSESVDDPYIEATSETGDDSARVRYSKERQGPTKLTWKIMRLGDFVALKQFYADHRAIEFLWLHPSRGLTYKTRFVSSPISSSEDGKSPFVAQVEVTLQIVELAPTEQEQPSASDLMDTINAGADKAVQAAIDAEQARDDAKEYAKKAAASAKEAADTAAEIPAAVEAGIERIEKAGASQISAVNSAGSTQVSKVNSAGTKQTTAVNNAGAAQVSKVNSAGTSQIAAVENAGSEQIAAVKAEGKAQTAAAKKQADAAAASAEEAAERLAEFKDLGAAAKTLAAGSKATASFDSSTGILTIGVPEGKKGDKGDPGTFSEDGVTVVANASGEAMAKDVAIGGDLGDLASARGQIGELKVATATEYPSILTIRKSCRLYFNGTEWAQVADRPFKAGYGAVVIANISSGALRGEIWAFSLSGNDAWKAQFNEKGTSPFARFVMSNAIGDGIRVTNGIISVPEYDGATASTSGTSGLVPPAAAGQQESFLNGGGEYKPALTKISDSVSLEDSTTAASAKAVKTAYDLANGKQANLGFTPVQQGGGTGQGSDKIYIGYSESGLKAQADTLDLGNVVTTSAGCTKAPSAALADNATIARNLVVTDDGQAAKFNWAGRSTGQPEWVWGGNAAEFGNMYTWNPANFSVNYATSASNAWQTTIVPNVVVGDNSNLPAGGTWTFYSYANSQVTYGAVAGGTYISGRYIAIRNA